MMIVAAPTREAIRQAIKDLHAASLKIVMLTGDNADTARAVAEELGIDEVHADITLHSDRGFFAKALQDFFT